MALFGILDSGLPVYSWKPRQTAHVHRCEKIDSNPVRWFFITIKIVGYKCRTNWLDVAGQYLGDDFPDVTGNEIYVVGSEKIVEARIFFMDMPGVEFEIYNQRSVLLDIQIPTDRSVIAKLLGVRPENENQDYVVGDDWFIRYK